MNPAGRPAGRLRPLQPLSRAAGSRRDRGELRLPPRRGLQLRDIISLHTNQQRLFVPSPTNERIFFLLFRNVDWPASRGHAACTLGAAAAPPGVMAMRRSAARPARRVAASRGARASTRRPAMPVAGGAAGYSHRPPGFTLRPETASLKGPAAVQIMIGNATCRVPAVRPRNERLYRHGSPLHGVRTGGSDGPGRVERLVQPLPGPVRDATRGRRGRPDEAKTSRVQAGKSRPAVRQDGTAGRRTRPGEPSGRGTGHGLAGGGGRAGRTGAAGVRGRVRPPR